ncbi:carbohydrate kinase family protein [Nocardia sp. NPDC058058]|uniref:carbohydrate kinase family protein n=1 Tax=Nocardia sp. NPDC058058 TaxID=3346317 RepID=UPI0036DD43E8
MAPTDPTTVAVLSILTRLRTRSGLSSDRLGSTEIDISTLQQLSVVARFAHVAGLTTEQAVPGVIAHVARQLPATHRLIVDAELCLGLFGDEPPAGIDLNSLYGPDLIDRRRYLAREWLHLHEAMGVSDIPPAPTVRTLRGAPELEAFTALATLMTSGSIPDTSGLDTVTVIGDAVIDQLYVVEQIPVAGTSAWGDFRRHPGGKGLNRAVALARLGLDARLVTAIGDDDDGESIRRYLFKQRVDTSLVKINRGGRTPVTAVIMNLTGQYASIAFKERRIQLTDADLESASIRQAIADSRAVLLTFEQSTDVVEQALRVVDSLSSPPWLIMNVSPPQVLPQSAYEYLRAVDYLVGTSIEMAELWPSSTPAEVIERLLGFGVGTVCTVDGSRCTIHRLRRPSVELSRFAAVLPGSAGAASAFSSALAYRLITRGKAADIDDFTWATAAIAATAPVRNVPDAMPTVEQIERIVARDRDDA